MGQRLSDRYLVGGLVSLEVAGIYIAAYGLMNQPFGIAAAYVRNASAHAVLRCLQRRRRSRARKIFAAWITLQCRRLPHRCYRGHDPEPDDHDDLSRPAVSGSVAPDTVYRRRHGTYDNLLNSGKGFPRAAEDGMVPDSPCRRGRSSVGIGLPLILAYGALGAALAVPIYYGLQVLACIIVINRCNTFDRAERRGTTCEVTS